MTTLTKPVLSELIPFDATQDITFSFAWSGYQTFKHTLTIKDNESNETISVTEIEDFRHDHLVSGGTLTNGKVYTATLVVTDGEGNESLVSDPLLFCCLDTPQLTLNITDGDRIHNSYFQLVINYSQAQSEELNYYQVDVCGTDYEVISTSGTIYDTSKMTYDIMNLEDDTKRYIRVHGATVNGMVVDTGYIAVHISYALPAVYTVFYLDNMKEQGAIQIKSYFVYTVGKYEPNNEQPTFIMKDNGDGYVDLTQDGTSVTFKDDFPPVKDDYCVGIDGNSFPINKVFCEVSDGNTIAQLYMRQGAFASTNNEVKNYVELKVFNNVTNYEIFSNFFTLTQGEDITIWLTKKHGLYEVEVLS